MVTWPYGDEECSALGFCAGVIAWILLDLLQEISVVHPLQILLTPALLLGKRSETKAS